MKIKKILILFAVAVIIGGVDQAMKYFARKGLLAFEGSGLFSIELYYNDRIAFGIPLSGWLVWVLWIIGIVFLLWLGKEAAKRSQRSAYVASGLVFGAAISNITDRVLFGGVVDYIKVATSIFNISDLAILVGFAWLLWITYGNDNALKSKNKSDTMGSSQNAGQGR